MSTAFLTRLAGRRMLVAVAALLLLPLRNTAVAQPSDPPAAEAHRDWRVSAGLAWASMPAYPGSDTHRTRWLPWIDARYRDRFFLSTVDGEGLGVDFVRDGGWRLAVALAPDFTRRRASDDARLAGLGDVEQTLRAQVTASCQLQGWTTRLRVGTDVAGRDAGTLASFDLLWRTRLGGGWMLSASPGFTWMSAGHASSFFGVDAQQNLRSGLPRFDARSGLRDAHLALGASLSPVPRWTVGLGLNLQSLQGDAADSPVTRRRGQASALVFASYGF